jgi:hypothetical protein
MPRSVALRGAAGYGAPLDQPDRKGTDPLPPSFMSRLNVGGWLGDVRKPLVTPDPPSATEVPSPALDEPVKPPQGEAVRQEARASAAKFATPQARETAPAPDAKGPRLMVELPTGEKVDYLKEPGRVDGAFGRDGFASSRRYTPVSARPAEVEQGPESLTGGHDWTKRMPSSQEQALDTLRFKRDLDFSHAAEAEQLAGLESRTEASRAATARSRALAEEPFAPEDIAARAKLGTAAVEAQTEVGRRNQILKISSQMAERINDLHSNPRFAALTPQQKQEAEQRIIDEATLTLGALGKINLSPRGSGNPFDFLPQGAPTAKKE